MCRLIAPRRRRRDDAADHAGPGFPRALPPGRGDGGGLVCGVELPRQSPLGIPHPACRALAPARPPPGGLRRGDGPRHRALVAVRRGPEVALPGRLGNGRWFVFPRLDLPHAPLVHPSIVDVTTAESTRLSDLSTENDGPGQKRDTPCSPTQQWPRIFPRARDGTAVADDA